MVRSNSPALGRLARSATGTDRDLDRALADVGVLAPADLDPIREVLARPDVELARSTNADGHVIIQVCWDSRLAALLHHDGRIQRLMSAPSSH